MEVGVDVLTAEFDVEKVVMLEVEWPEVCTGSFMVDLDADVDILEGLGVECLQRYIGNFVVELRL